MGRQIQIHATAVDINNLLIGLRDNDVEMALQRGNTATPERVAFISDNLNGHTFVLPMGSAASVMHVTGVDM